MTINQLQLKLQEITIIIQTIQLITANDDNDDSQLIMYFSPTSNFSTLRLQQILHVKPYALSGKKTLDVEPKKDMVETQKSQRFNALHLH